MDAKGFVIPSGGGSVLSMAPGRSAARDRKHLAHLLTERSPEGELVLQRRSDGACVHLGERGCTVYERRPAVCRTFDCRVFAAMGLVERCGPSQQTPGWEFAGC
jgi:Fe-S-cluster containining protein